MKKEENGCRSPSTASLSSKSYWGWEWRRTSLLREYMNWTCVYCNLLYTSCIAWVITLATEIRQNEPPWASETSSDMWSPRCARHCYAPLAPWGGITYHCSFSSAHGGSFTYHPPIVGWYSVRITFSKEYHLCYTYQYLSSGSCQSQKMYYYFLVVYNIDLCLRFLCCCMKILSVLKKIFQANIHINSLKTISGVKL